MDVSEESAIRKQPLLMFWLILYYKYLTIKKRKKKSSTFSCAVMCMLVPSSLDLVASHEITARAAFVLTVQSTHLPVCTLSLYKLGIITCLQRAISLL